MNKDTQEVEEGKMSGKKSRTINKQKKEEEGESRERGERSGGRGQEGGGRGCYSASEFLLGAGDARR